MHSWILNSVSPTIARGIIHVENACREWNILKEQFHQGNSIRVAQLRQELDHSKQGTLSVTDFFTNLTTIWEELDAYRPTPESKCPVKCACDAMTEMLKYKENGCVIRSVTA